MDDIWTFAAEILEKESEAILKCKTAIDNNFIKAVECIKNCNGKVLTTGVGKSGNIAAKIASTLASTGTPSVFIHPTEASHGDLGIISQDDLILALSNSGETIELFNIIRYANRFSIPLISIVANQESSLAKASTIVIVIPKLQEAGLLNIAPTSSTTAMLAVGDAIALCVCKENNFTVNNFKNLHPGGSLGKKLLKVSDIMKIGPSQIPFGSPGLTAEEVINSISEKGQGCLAIINNNEEILGIITDGDLRRSFGDSFFSKHASDLMTKDPILTYQEDLAVNALKLMNNMLITNLLVTENKNSKKIVGILHVHDCIKAGIA